MSHDELQKNRSLKAITLLHYKYTQVYQIIVKIYSIPLANIQNSIYINKSKSNVEKVKCKEYYWHLINKFSHLPKISSSILK